MKKYFLTISILLLTFSGTAFATTLTIPYNVSEQPYPNTYRVQDATPSAPASYTGDYYLLCNNATGTIDLISKSGTTFYNGTTSGWLDGDTGFTNSNTFEFRLSGQTFQGTNLCGGDIQLMYNATPTPTPTATPSPTPTPTISITTPTGSVDNFGMWTGSCYAYGSDYGQIAIMYGDNNPATNTISAWDYTEYSSTKGNCADINSSDRYWNLSRTHELDLATTTTWYARAIYYKPVCTGTFPNQTCVNDVYAYGTTTWNFMSNASTSLVYADPINTYIPLPELTRSKIEIYTDIENKFPFAYFYDLRNIYFQARTFAEGQFPSFTVNMASSSLPIVANLFSSTTLTTYAGSGAITFVKGFITASLWLALGFYIYQRIKNLQL